MIIRQEAGMGIYLQSRNFFENKFHISAFQKTTVAHRTQEVDVNTIAQIVKSSEKDRGLHETANANNEKALSNNEKFLERLGQHDKQRDTMLSILQQVL